MPATIAELGERALRRLGVAVVAVADRPAMTGTGGSTIVATRALQILGVPVPAPDRVLNVATVTIADLGRLALERLEVIAADEEPNVLDAARAAFAVSAVHDALIAQGFAAWPETAIPRAVAEEYMVLVAIHLATTFGRQADPAQIPIMEARVRRVASVRQAQTLAETAAAQVHQSLAAQGLAFWPVGEIPDALIEDHAQLVALRLAPYFGTGPLDAAAQATIEARLRRTAMVLRGPALAAQAVLDVHATLDARGKVRWSVYEIPDHVEPIYVVLAANALAPQFAMPADERAGMAAERDLMRVISLPSSGERTVAEYF